MLVTCEGALCVACIPLPFLPWVGLASAIVSPYDNALPMINKKRLVALVLTTRFMPLIDMTFIAVGPSFAGTGGGSAGSLYMHQCRQK